MHAAVYHVHDALCSERAKAAAKAEKGATKVKFADDDGSPKKDADV